MNQIVQQQITLRTPQVMITMDSLQMLMVILSVQQARQEALLISMVMLTGLVVVIKLV